MRVRPGYNIESSEEGSMNASGYGDYQNMPQQQMGGYQIMAQSQTAQSQAIQSSQMRSEIPEPPDVEPRADQPMSMQAGAMTGPLTVGPQSTPTSEEAMGILDGCFGFAAVFKICWKVDIAALKADVTIKAAGLDLGHWTLDANRTCISISLGIPYVAKIGAQICVSWAQRRIYMNGKACYYKWFSGWKCATLSNVTIASW